MLIRSSLLVALLLLIGLASTAQAQFRLNPQVGISASTLSTDPMGTEATARLGYQIGLNARLGGGRLYLQPGIFWQRSGSNLRTFDTIDLNQIKDEVDIDALFLSAGLGYYLLNGNNFGVRLQGGLAFTFVQDVQNNQFQLDKDNFKAILAGVPIGAGLDLLNFITADVTYEIGVTDVFEEAFGVPVEATNNVLRVNIGVMF